MAYVIQICRQLSSRIILILLESCLQTCMTYTIAECTVNDCWWWTEELSETCRVSFQNKFEKLVHLVGFIIRKYFTKHGHVNVKKDSLEHLNGLHKAQFALCNNHTSLCSGTARVFCLLRKLSKFRVCLMNWVCTSHSMWAYVGTSVLQFRGLAVTAAFYGTCG
jgi:hypothetical protein